MSKFEDFFTPLDELRKTEPNYGKPIVVESVPEKSRIDLGAFLSKTPLQILEEGSTAAYQEKVDWLMQQYGTEFEMTCQLRGTRGVGRNINKRIAKQKAAVDFLRKIVDKGLYKEFLVPGLSAPDAHNSIDQLEKIEEARKLGESPLTPVKKPATDDSFPTSDKLPDTNIDWVGKLQELLHKLRYEAPTYECTEDGEPTNRKFIFLCIIANHTTRGISSTKKTAKKIAAYLMYDILEKGAELLDQDVFEGDENEQDWHKSEEAEHLRQINEICLKEKDAENALRTLLSDTKRFSDYSMEYKCQSFSTIGNKQALVVISATPIIHSDEDELEIGAEHTNTEEIAKAAAQKEKERKQKMDAGPRVFCGDGRTERDAQQNACQSALIYFNTYEF
ncbi:unnamed protein product [Caenorhabditis angaria]|uniref:DRBM domain-containing protein n=1 Tax=Caenorhabditis angaria TaxID=860376 RepID=A0A9P1IJ05_9PELO|nr:unnamed protein product [Caenorhabditis angaria]